MSVTRRWLGALQRAFGAKPVPRGKPARGEPDRPPLPRLVLEHEPDTTYAIGDVHGCLDQFRELEARILADARGRPGSKIIVMLGDYVDRGPDSAGVLAHLAAPPPEGLRRVALRGNHDDVLLRLLEGKVDPRWWLGFGGAQTLLSYGIDPAPLGHDRRALASLVRRFAAEMPRAHRRFLAACPVALMTPRHLFCHAGARPGVVLEAQSDEDLLWLRGPFLEHRGAPFERTVVHGHTPAPTPFVSPYRIGLDTNACRGGRLSAARLVGREVTILQA